jgi:chorismate mutase
LHFIRKMKEIAIQSTWETQKKKPIIIAGPCSAESLEQLQATASAIKKIKAVDFFRAGAWKPRTRISNFEGKGEEAIRWLSEIQTSFSMPVCTEIANPNHLEICLKYGINNFWIGSRTVVNPFSVNDISEALRGVEAKVMLKNPMNPDIDLWIGAIERVYRAGITDIAAIHRGFYTYNKSNYRNNPLWQIPIELKRRIPFLPIICDVSHICGKSELISEIAQWAMDLEMDGLMIESHIEAEKALTDARQQISPNDLLILLKNIQIPVKKNVKLQAQLNRLRLEIDETDKLLLQQLAQRMEIIKRMGEIKAENNISILQMERWKKILSERTEIGENLGIDKSFLFSLLQLIHEESIKIQAEINRKKE